MKLSRTVILALLLSNLLGCMPMTYPPGTKTNTAQLKEAVFITEDGANLPLHRWLPDSSPQAIIIALHGFNDYSLFFQEPGQYLSKLGIACFAYDQRGFGASPKLGLWAGSAAYSNDLLTMIQLVKNRYPNRPLYLVGESMGGAIVINAMSQANRPAVEGVILVAPALWARSTMPWYQTSLLWTAAHSLPWLTLTGEGVKVMPSDNIEMLRALGRDPLIIKATRVETIYGLTDLMDEAFNSATRLNGNTLMMYGENDDIIPKEPTYQFLKQFLATDISDKTVALYSKGYHMLLRDLQAPTAWKDIATWIINKPEKLPSGADIRAQQILTELNLQNTKTGN
jgi:alpha-beta hydrolase superfamily lysophospholipase